MNTNSPRLSESNDSPLISEHDHTETTKVLEGVREKPFSRPQTPRRNNIAYIIIAICIYFQENYYSSVVPDLLNPDKVGLCLSFIFIPALILKLFFINMLSKLSVRTRILISSLLFVVSSLLFTIILRLDYMEKKDNEIVKIIVVIMLNSLSSLGMGLGEVSALENASCYQKTCAANYSTGHGLSGVLAAGIALALGYFMTPSERLGVGIIPGIVLAITQVFLLGEMKFPNIGRVSISKGKTEEGIKKPKQKYSVLQMLKILFFGPFTYYSFTFFFDYLLYFLSYSGIVSVSKSVLKYQKAGLNCKVASIAGENCSSNEWLSRSSYLKPAGKEYKSFFGWAFFILKGCTFLCKLLPYVISFYKVAYFPCIHVPTSIAIILVTKYCVNKIAILLLAAPIGISHGLSSSYVIIALRKKIEDRWLKFGLKYITVASSLGGSMGCLIAILVSNAIEMLCDINY
eukprot:GAHX01000421.1.p1 GENE.GAHX01000421.1~~GAHX01000421.1.p1  ORF type:complete len:459 (+),score=40.29 GAHX01000421.1:59-1435(+)